MHVHVRHLLPGTRSIVNQNEEIFRVKNGAQATLSFSHAVHQESAFLSLEVGQSRYTSFRDDEGMARPSRKDVKEGVPTLAASNGVRRKAALDDAFEQRRPAHKRAWCAAAFNPHADSEGARTQWPETPFRTARVSVVPSEETRVWCI